MALPDDVSAGAHFRRFPEPCADRGETKDLAAERPDLIAAAKGG